MHQRPGANAEPEPTSNPGTGVARRAYRLNEFCEAFRISRSTAYELIAAGTLPSVLVCGRRLIPADAAEALLRRKGG